MLSHKKAIGQRAGRFSFAALVSSLFWPARGRQTKNWAGASENMSFGNTSLCLEFLSPKEYL